MGPRVCASVLERDGAKRKRRFWEAAEGWRQAYRAGAADRDALWQKTVPRESCSARSCDRWKLRDRGQWVVSPRKMGT